MATARYEPSLAHVLVHEGGYVNHPADSGGATNRGVIQRVYDGWRDRQGKPRRSVREIEEAEVRAIYRRQYWDAVKGDQLPEGVDLVVFDGAVNSGPAQSIKWLQRALGVKADGMIGEATLAAVEAHGDHDQLIAAILDRRMAFLRQLRHWSTFGRGWTRRVTEVRRTAQAWASGSVAPAPTPEAGRQRATIDQAKASLPTAPADAATGGGIAAGGLGATLQQAQDALAPLAASSQIVAHIVAGLVVGGVALTVAGIAWRAFASWRNGQRAEALGLEVAA